MSRPRLTIVLPVYNVEPYLPRCLESLAELDPPADEIIAVDDGSTDGCPRILADYARRIAGLRIVRRANGGLSVARNTGLEHASGEFVAFVDADDFVESHAYRAPLAVAEGEALDMVLFNGVCHYEGRRPDHAVYEDLAPTAVTEGREWLRARLRAGRLLHMVWLHLYRRAFIERAALRFVPGIVHEDVIWTVRALLAARRVRVLDHVAVHYRIRVRRFSPEQNQRRLVHVAESSIENARTLLALAETLAGDAELQRLLRFHAVDGAFSIFHKIEKMPDRAAAAALRRRLAEEGFLRLLWENAYGVRQHRRVLRQMLLARLA